MRTEIDPVSAPPFRLLVVDDDPVQRRLVGALAERIGGRAVAAEGCEAALRWLADGEAGFDVLVLDLGMPDGSGLDVLARLRLMGAAAPPAIVQTGRAGIEAVVEAMRAGAFDFVVKPASPEKLAGAIRAALQAGRGDGGAGGDLALRPGGGTGAMAPTLRLAAKAARSAIPVLLTGETGTGKEWLARRIVAAGGRARAPFVAVNCGALPRDLAESVLFGHERGAFTGAAAAHPGRFLEADGGTLLLDEVGDLAPEIQVKLLRALQEGEVEPLGGTGAPRRIDVRVIAATNHDLASLMREGRFREDLYWRLAAFPIHLPPLRERRGEIADLAARFAARLPPGPDGRPRRIAPTALRLLEGRPWPGNIRELENAVHRAGVLADGASLEPADFAMAGEPTGAAPTTAEAPLLVSSMPDAGIYEGSDAPLPTLAEHEAELIRRALRRNGGRLAKTALDLGIGRSTLYRKLQLYGMDGDSDSR